MSDDDEAEPEPIARAGEPTSSSTMTPAVRPHEPPSWPPLADTPAAWGQATSTTAWPEPSKDSWTHPAAPPEVVPRSRRGSLVLVALGVAIAVLVATALFVLRGH